MFIGHREDGAWEIFGDVEELELMRESLLEAITEGTAEATILTETGVIPVYMERDDSGSL